MKLRIAAVTAGIALAIVAPVTTASAAGPTMSAHSQDAGPFGIGVVVTLTNTGSRTIGGCVFGLRQGGHAPVAPGQLQAGRIPVGSTWSGAFPPVPAGKYRVSALLRPVPRAIGRRHAELLLERRSPRRLLVGLTRSAAAGCPLPRRSRRADRRARCTRARSMRR